MVRATDAQVNEAIAKIKRSLAYRRAATDLDYVAVCLIGCENPVPYRVGSNATKWPVRVVTSREPETAAKRPDLEQPLHALVCLEYVWTTSEPHAKRLKGALETAMIGDDPDLTRLRHSWVDCPDPSVAWTILLGDALRALRSGGETVEIFAESAKVQRVINKMRGRVAR